jgi:hypothetical protein
MEFVFFLYLVYKVASLLQIACLQQKYLPTVIEHEDDFLAIRLQDDTAPTAQVTPTVFNGKKNKW